MQAAAQCRARPATPQAARSSRAQGIHIAARCQAADGQQLETAAASRRGVLALTGAALLASAAQQQRFSARAEEAVADVVPEAPKEPQAPAQPAVPMKSLQDDTLAYSFEYPAATASGKPLPLLFSRKPERYSSAAPLTADARQRIVCELADLIDAVTVSVTVGPPAGLLKGKTPEQWTARQVAEQVLIDRSTARITTGQRVSLNSVEASQKQERDGVPYFTFEHVSQGSPTMRTAARETYRHSYAVTAVRPGVDGSPYLYTLNMSCPQELWPDVADAFAAGIASFRLLPPTDKYVAPDEQGWRFF